jgi:hypothetical protein
MFTATCAAAGAAPAKQLISVARAMALKPTGTFNIDNLHKKDDTNIECHLFPFMQIIKPQDT